MLRLMHFISTLCMKLNFLLQTKFYTNDELEQQTLGFMSTVYLLDPSTFL